MMKKRLLLRALIVLGFSSFCVILTAQDVKFSQYYAAPLYLNPALTGGYSGSYKVAAIYRDQWRGAYDEPLQTFGLSGDVRFDVGNQVMGGKDAASGGLMFLSDRVNIFDYNTTFVGLSGAYHKSLNRKNNAYLSGGFRFAMINKSINLENLTFQDQFNGIDSYIFETKESLPFSSISYPDLAVGLNFSVNPKERAHFSIGASVDHLIANNTSFYSNEDLAPGQAPFERELKLYKKFMADIQYTFPLNRKVQLGPRVAYMQQANFVEFNAGTILRIINNISSGFGFQIGAWVRVNNYLESMDFNAATAMVGLELDNVLFAISYDTNIADYASMARNRDAFEISVSFIGEYEDDVVMCPKF